MRLILTFGRMRKFLEKINKVYKAKTNDLRVGIKLKYKRFSRQFGTFLQRAAFK